MKCGKQKVEVEWIILLRGQVALCTALLQSWTVSEWLFQILKTNQINGNILGIKVLQELHDTPPLCLFLLLYMYMFWHKKYQCIYQIWSNPPIISQDIEHKQLNIILKSIKGHNSVEMFGKIMCISHNMDHIYTLYINAKTKFYQNLYIISKDIEKNWNFNINHGP